MVIFEIASGDISMLSFKAIARIWVEKLITKGTEYILVKAVPGTGTLPVVV